MSLFKKLFKKPERPVVQDMRGAPELQTQDERDATRSRMEAEMTTQREHRASDAAGAPPANQT